MEKQQKLRVADAVDRENQKIERKNQKLREQLDQLPRTDLEKNLERKKRLTKKQVEKMRDKEVQKELEEIAKAELKYRSGGIVDMSLLHLVVNDIRAVFEELAERQLEALNLYEPLPEALRFHQCAAPERIVRGSNRAGKTIVTSVEGARILTGKDPFDKYPKEDGRIFAVGKDGKYLGDVMYRKMFKPGAFRIIKDGDKWRSFRPWDKADHERRKESKPAPPLVPLRLIKEISWENKKASTPGLVRITNGWEMNFFSSLGLPPQGSDIDVAWLSEEIVNREWYNELSARLLDRAGMFFWDATPQAGTEQLYALSQTAEDERGKEKPRVVEFLMLLEDNPYIPEEQKQLLAMKFTDPEQYRIRVKGEFALLSLRVFPEFSRAHHVVKAFPIPKDWTVYCSIDPGHQICGVLFIAVPPDSDKEHGGKKYAFDELYIPQCTAAKFAQEFAAKLKFLQKPQGFLIDGHMGRHTEMGLGITIEEHYSRALREAGVSSVTTGHGFAWGADNVEAGLEAIRTWLQFGPDDKPTLMIFDRCTNFIKETEKYYYKRNKDTGKLKPTLRFGHLIDNARYLSSFGCPYVKPKDKDKPVSFAVRAMQKKRERKREKDGNDYVRLGPAGGAV